MLIGVVVVFLVCQMPQALQHTYVVYLSADITLKVNKCAIAVFLSNYDCCTSISASGM